MAKLLIESAESKTHRFLVTPRKERWELALPWSEWAGWAPVTPTKSPKKNGTGSGMRATWGMARILAVVFAGFAVAGAPWIPSPKGACSCCARRLSAEELQSSRKSPNWSPARSFGTWWRTADRHCHRPWWTASGKQPCSSFYMIGAHTLLHDLTWSGKVLFGFAREKFSNGF